MIQNNSIDDVEAPFVIKNLDTGEVFNSVAEFGELNLTQFTQFTQSAIKNSEKWKNFWSKMNDINERLLDACESCQLEVVEALLKDQRNLKIEAQAAVDKSQSISNDEYLNIIGMLDVNCKGLDDWTALHHAVNGRSEQIVILLLMAKANPNLMTHMKRTPLHLACLRSSLEIVKLLVDHQADLDAQDNDFNTPMHIAAELGQSNIVEYLIKSGAKADVKNHQQKTPFDVTMSIAVRNIIRSNTQVQEGYHSRGEIEGMIVRNSRADHIEKLLGQVNNLNKIKQQQQPINEPKITQINITLSGPESYNFHKLLGKGSFGEVYLATHKQSGEVYAIKTLNKDKVFSKNLTRYAQTEKNVLSVMKHPFIVRLHAAFQSQAKLFMVLDYCPGGDLGNLLTKHTKLQEDKARFYICEIILALEELHKNCIIFRDLKPDNVVLDANGHAKLTDFGLSKEGIFNNITRSFCGSIAYLAPEVLMKRGHSRTVDWYLLGVLLYEMIVGIPPYYNQNREQLFENIKKGVLKIPKTMSDEAKDLIKNLLIRDPSQRLGAKNDASDIKNHMFFKNIIWDDVYNKVHDGPFIEKDKAKVYMKDKLEMKFDDPSQEIKKVQDWSFVQ